MTYQILKWIPNTGVKPERDGPMLVKYGDGNVYLFHNIKGGYWPDLEATHYAYIDEQIDPLEALLDGYEPAKWKNQAELMVWRNENPGFWEHYRKKPVTPPKTPEQLLADLIAQIGTEEALRRLG